MCWATNNGTFAYFASTFAPHGQNFGKDGFLSFPQMLCLSWLVNGPLSPFPLVWNPFLLLGWELSSVANMLRATHAFASSDYHGLGAPLRPKRVFNSVRQRQFPASRQLCARQLRRHDRPLCGARKLRPASRRKLLGFWIQWRERTNAIRLRSAVRAHNSL